MNVARCLQQSVDRCPDRVAVRHGETDVWSFSEFEKNVKAGAERLRKRGVLPGDRVGMFMENHPDYIIWLYAILYADCVLVPINCRLHEQELAYILKDSAARFCISSDKTSGTVLRALAMAGLELGSVGSREYLQLRPTESQESSVYCKRSNEDTAWIFYTSGTTGVPKGVELSHSSLWLMMTSFPEELVRVNQNHQLVHFAPLSHGSGMYVFPVVRAAGCQVLPRSSSFSTDEAITLSSRLENMIMFMAPALLNKLVRLSSQAEKFPGIAMVVYDGAPMTLVDCMLAVEKFSGRLAQIYGQGECPMTISTLTSNDHIEAARDITIRKRLSSAGRPFRGIKVAIAKSVESVEGAVVGEILVSGPIVMKGYWRNSEATGEAFQDGWLKTGDVGYIDDDGYLYLCDRVKDMIISGGLNIYSREIEDVLMEHAAVEEVAVLGLPSPEWGEEVVAVVKCKNNYSVPPGELTDLCGSRMARFKIPKRYVFVKEIPKSAYGKPDKRSLKLTLG